MLQQPNEGQCFSKRVLHFEKQKLVSAWNQRIGRKVASNDATWLSLLATFVITWRIKQINHQNIAKPFTHPSIMDKTIS